jgi:hypothetical protein
MPYILVEYPKRCCGLFNDREELNISKIHDTTNVTRARGPIATAAHEVGRNSNQESKSDTCLLRL